MKIVIFLKICKYLTVKNIFKMSKFQKKIQVSCKYLFMKLVKICIALQQYIQILTIVWLENEHIHKIYKILQKSATFKYCNSMYFIVKIHLFHGYLNI